ncbi:hypothetical protein D0Z00_000781 [Geotrichum galactomycetum]|uniref:Uncharacterized protein n=1 Tax=Geotrichum galactomycetum TaxID=27317 RepID=A0ACB6V8Y5_9ASCO|nr:hypothetical protein D0Z00_000781 [Geotrichum candidum]
MQLFNLALFLSLAIAPTATRAEIDPALEAKWGTDWPFSGIATFAHLETEKCLIDPKVNYDIAVVGVPFDTAVSYRPGARFGPRSVRSASMRQSSLRGFNFRADINPYQNWAKVIDCADIPVTPMDNQLALRQMTEGYGELLTRPTTNKKNLTPRIVAIGGDHSIALASLRALSKLYGPVTVIHFDAHLDTWAPNKYPSTWGEPANFTHGTMFWMARQEGLLANNSCIHAGLRTRLSGVDWSDYEDDSELGFARIGSDDIFTKGTDGIIKEILERVPATAPVYLSVDIDVIDPGMAPGTGTPEVGGWQTRELIRIIRGLESLNLVGADLVEVAPAYDHAEITALAGAQIVYELVSNMVKKGPTLDFKPLYLDQAKAAVRDEL